MRATMRLALVAVLAAGPTGAAAQTPPGPPAGWIGTWTLNLGKSRYVPGPPPYRRAQYRIEPHPRGVRVVYEMVYPRGGVSHMEWIGALDGRDYPLQGLDEAMTYAYRPRDDGSYEVVVKVDGRQVASSTIVLSSDGRTMTTTTAGTNASGRRVETVTVYEKRAEGIRDQESGRFGLRRSVP